VKVSTDAGITGWGDATEWARPEGHVAVIEADLAPQVIGEDPFNIEKLWQKMWIAGYVGGKDLSLGMTGIETALWDIVGKALGTPVYNLLGGRVHDKLRLYGDFCDGYGSGFRGGTKWNVGDTSMEGIAKHAQWFKDQKFTALKTHPVVTRPTPVNRAASLKMISATAKKIRTIREVVGDDLDICMDMHGMLDMPSAMAMTKALEPYHLMFFEDPLRQDEPAAAIDYSRLAESTSTPIGTGENLYTVWDFRNYLEVGGLDLMLPDICHTGILQAKKIAALGEAYHLPLAPHNPNSPLSTIISGHLCASIPNFLCLEYFPLDWEPPWVDQVMSPAITSLVKDGYLELPSGPGWGVEVNEEELLRHPHKDTWHHVWGHGYAGLDIG
jgi:galactonate dehydratase